MYLICPSLSGLTITRSPTLYTISSFFSSSFLGFAFSIFFLVPFFLVPFFLPFLSSVASSFLAFLSLSSAKAVMKTCKILFHVYDVHPHICHVFHINSTPHSIAHPNLYSAY
eukprot:633785_1